jgi:hypothetical protein
MIRLFYQRQYSDFRWPTPDWNYKFGISVQHNENIANRFDDRNLPDFKKIICL